MRRLLDFTHTMRMKYFTILWIQKRLDLEMIRLQCHLHVYFKILRNYSFCVIIGFYKIINERQKKYGLCGKLLYAKASILT